MENEAGEKKKNILEAVGIEAVFIGVIILVIIGILAYLNIIPVSTILGWLPTTTKSSPPKNIIDRSRVNNTPITAQKIKIFSCPVLRAYCDSRKRILFQNNSALLYNVPAGNIVRTLSFYTLQSKPYKVDDLQGFSQTFIYNNNCYTASYLFPSDAKLETIKEEPFGPNLPLGTLGELTYKNGENNGNVIMQLQKRSLDKPLIPRHEVESCELLTKEKKDYGSYEDLNSEYYNR